MLLVALPMRNTEYKSKLRLPLRAPTIRSVPEIVSAKLWRAPVRTFSTPRSNITLRAMEKIVRSAVSQRLASDCSARRTMIKAVPPHPNPLPVEFALASAQPNKAASASGCGWEKDRMRGNAIHFSFETRPGRLGDVGQIDDARETARQAFVM